MDLTRSSLFGLCRKLLLCVCGTALKLLTVADFVSPLGVSVRLGFDIDFVNPLGVSTKLGLDTDLVNLLGVSIKFGLEADFVKVGICVTGFLLLAARAIEAWVGVVMDAIVPDCGRVGVAGRGLCVSPLDTGRAEDVSSSTCFRARLAGAAFSRRSG